MGARDDDEDARLADLEAAEAVEDRDVADLELFEGLGGERLDLAEGHLAVGLVVEVEGLAVAGVVADNAFEGADGTVRTGLDLRDHLVYGENFVEDFSPHGRLR